MYLRGYAPDPVARVWMEHALCNIRVANIHLDSESNVLGGLRARLESRKDLRNRVMSGMRTSLFAAAKHCSEQVNLGSMQPHLPLQCASAEDVKVYQHNGTMEVTIACSLALQDPRVIQSPSPKPRRSATKCPTSRYDWRSIIITS
jgi:hypothetical protein